MKTFKEWYKNISGIEPKYEIAADKIQWLVDRGLPVIVTCTRCECPRTIFKVYFDDEDNIYCPTCAGER